VAGREGDSRYLAIELLASNPVTMIIHQNMEHNSFFFYFTIDAYSFVPTDSHTRS
jgi:hypothetical protein